MTVALPSAAALSAWGALERRNRECRGSLTEFVQEAARNEEGDAIQLAPMHLAWHRHLDYCWSHGLRCLIMAPMGHGKSSGLCVPLVAWLIGNDVQRRIKMVSNSDDMARERVRSVKRLMESPTYQQIFPNVVRGDKWGDGDLLVQRVGHSSDPTVQARGVFTMGVGKRADVIIFDDVCDQKNSEEQAQRRKVRNLLDQTWLTRLEPGKGLALLVATAWHVEDATHGLMVTPGWCSLVQRVNSDCSAIDQEVTGALPGVPYPTGAGALVP